MEKIFNVLLVEDNPGDAFLIQERFKTAKTHIFYLNHVEYLAQAIALLAQNSFDVILLDLSLPDSRGIETLKTIKEHSWEIPIVILSGINDEELAIQAVRQGAQDYLVKGKVNGETLVHALRYAIERKLIEEQLKIKQAQLEAVNQELKAFSYMVSHDLRNPLTVIKGMSSLLKRQYELPGREVNDREKFYIEHICEAGDRMEQIIDDLMLLSQVKQQDLNVTPVNVSNLARKIVKQFQQEQPFKEVKITIQPSVIAIADQNLLSHAIENLLHNAWKYTGDQSESQIELGVIDSNPVEVRESLAQLDLEAIDSLHQRNRIRSVYRKLVYFIRDNGIGFNPTTAEKLFTPFYRLDNAKKFPGTGIGLAIVQSIIHRHNGRVWAQAEENRGATFYFTLGL